MSNLTLNVYALYKTTPFLQFQGPSVKDLWGIGEEQPEYFYYAS